MGRPDDLFKSVFVTHHALDAYRIQFPNAWHTDFLRSLSHGEELDQKMAMTLLARKDTSHRASDRFILADHRRGLHVVGPSGHVLNQDDRPDLMPWVAITYLRFQAEQERQAHRLWPTDRYTPSETPSVIIRNSSNVLAKAHKAAEALDLAPIEYEVITQTGAPHDPYFQVRMNDRDGQPLSEGFGGTKQAAKEKAAALWLTSLRAT